MDQNMILFGSYHRFTTVTLQAGKVFDPGVQLIQSS
jgi:hypothetical protein